MAVGINETEVVGEPRWHMGGAVVAALVLIVLLPDGERIGPPGCSRSSRACCSSR